MICVFFVPGMFGSTIEYVIRNYSEEMTPVPGHILPDGSMHSFQKQAHLLNQADLINFFSNKDSAGISTPIYPFQQLHFDKILELYYTYSKHSWKNILLYANNVDHAEINMLFQYYKIALGLGKGLDIFCGENQHNITAWNKDYVNWKQMQPWELREWLSLFYVGWVQEWIHSVTQVGKDFLCIENYDFLTNPTQCIQRIFNHCNLSLKPGMHEFMAQWSQAQQYIRDQFETLTRIITASTEQKDFSWQPLPIIAEAIIQQRLRAKGYEIRCDKLNEFPTDSSVLYNLLEKV